jgi:hypothetical protein
MHLLKSMKENLLGQANEIAFIFVQFLTLRERLPKPKKTCNVLARALDATRCTRRRFEGEILGAGSGSNLRPRSTALVLAIGQVATISSCSNVADCGIIKNFVTLSCT